MRPNSVGPPFRTLCAKTGSNPCKGAARNMKVTPMIVRRRVPGVVQTNFKPSRTSSYMELWLLFDGADVFGIATNRATNRGRNVQALKVNAPTTPTAPISAAANIGPHNLAILNWTEFSAMARSNSPRGTRLGTTERKTGPLSAHTIPSRNVNVMTTQGVARPRNAATASPTANANADIWRVINQTFRFTRSEITPASS